LKLGGGRTVAKTQHPTSKLVNSRSFLLSMEYNEPTAKEDIAVVFR
jgi:hypothetical protein